jgi:energy-coupling factor transporter transmembrane protein EcfT
MNAFQFRSGHTPLHLMDVRFKLLLFVFLVFASLNAATWALILLLALQLFLFKLFLRMSLVSSLYSLRYFLVFLLSIVVLRTLASPGSPGSLSAFPAVSWQGLGDGADLALRMLAAVFFGILLVATTRPTEIKAAVEWLFKRVPGVPAVRIGTMLGLLLRFMPLIFQQAGQTLDAQRARGVEHRRNPAYRITRFAVPFMRRTVASADRLALAMSARGYRDQRTLPRLAAGRRDWILLTAGIAFGVLMVVI